MDVDHKKPSEKFYGIFFKGMRGDDYCCAQEIKEPDSLGSRQCTKPAGYGVKGLYCKQHTKKYYNQDEEVLKNG